MPDQLYCNNTFATVNPSGRCLNSSATVAPPYWSTTGAPPTFAAPTVGRSTPQDQEPTRLASCNADGAQRLWRTSWEPPPSDARDAAMSTPSGMLGPRQFWWRIPRLWMTRASW